MIRLEELEPARNATFTPQLSKHAGHAQKKLPVGIRQLMGVNKCYFALMSTR